MILGNNIYIGVDPASPDGDYGCITYVKKPSRLRKLMRRIGLDKTTWETKVVRMEYTDGKS